jgi:voltage-gated potassium channel
MKRWPEIDPNLASETRFTPLLMSLVIYVFAVLPFLDPGADRNLVVNVVFSILLASGVLAVSKTKKTRVRTALVVVGLLALNWWKFFHQSRLTVVITLVLIGIAILGGSFLVLRQVLRARRVSFQTIQGAICGYLLLVLWWSFLYFLIGLFNEDSFRGLVSDSGRASTDYLYFSFVTMTTLGYGDISPISEAARSLVNLQALTGQFYMAILVARLVAIQTRGEA